MFCCNFSQDIQHAPRNVIIVQATSSTETLNLYLLRNIPREMKF